MKRLLLLFFLSVSVLSKGFTQYPGGIASEIQFWLKADTGVLHMGVPGMDGQQVNEWVDQSGVRINNARIGSVNTVQFPDFTPDGPTFRNNPQDNINYHPVLEFDGVDDGLDFGNDFIFSSGTGNQDGLSILVVAKADSTTSKRQQYLFDFGRRLNNTANQGNYAGIYGDDVVQILSPSVSDATTDATSFFGQIDNTSTTVVRYIFDFDFRRQEISLNSNKLDFFLIGNTTTQLTNVEIENASFHQRNRGPFSIGRQSRQRYLENNGGRLFQGKIAEMIAYSQNLSSKAWNIESYLMVKYGITMRTSSSYQANEGDYLASNNTRIWNLEASNFDYRHDIIGIGRDDTTALYQKQSHTQDDSVRIYLGTLAASNADNPHPISNDISYLIIGDNNAQMSSSGVLEMPDSLFSRLGREWKITNTHFSDEFSWDIRLSSEVQNGGLVASDLRVLVDTNGDFSDASLYASGDMGLNIAYTSGVVSITGISNSIVPQNTTRYLSIGSANSTTPLLPVPLPVELVDFTAKVEDNHVRLQWHTASEVNNDYFVIEKSVDALAWKAMLKQKGAGTTQSAVSYRVVDPEPFIGTSYYRLKQIDYDGSFSYSRILSVHFSQSDLELRLFPNPSNASQGIQIHLPNYEKSIQVKVYDLQGKEKVYLKGRKATVNQTLNQALIRLKGGLYIFQIAAGSNVWTQKMAIHDLP